MSTGFRDALAAAGRVTQSGAHHGVAGNGGACFRRSAPKCASQRKRREAEVGFPS
jgi:hypothetical protein